MKMWNGVIFVAAASWPPKIISLWMSHLKMDYTENMEYTPRMAVCQRRQSSLSSSAGSRDPRFSESPSYS